VILGIDPGTRKCGYALLAATGRPPEAFGIVETDALPMLVAQLLTRHTIATIAMGSGTHAAPLCSLLGDLGVPVRVVDERDTTLRARARYFADCPPRGWRRLIPRGMLLPPRPIDDYAALLIAERYLAGQE
ncbi:MAG: pre-16S rRNA-processing nuclease YqgF, partial [Vulcanimicrobiaceae bacterium]